MSGRKKTRQQADKEAEKEVLAQVFSCHNVLYRAPGQHTNGSIVGTCKILVGLYRDANIGNEHKFQFSSTSRCSRMVSRNNPLANYICDYYLEHVLAMTLGVGVGCQFTFHNCL